MLGCRAMLPSAGWAKKILYLMNSKSTKCNIQIVQIRSALCDKAI
jgi:hypothetical protein